jgi:cell division protein FtsL
MAPSSAGTIRRVASSRAEPSRPDAARPPLKVVPPRRRNARRRRRIVVYLPAVMVVLALLIVVAGQALLANGQVRIASLDQQLQTAQAQHSQRELSVAKMETPSRIVGDATGQLQMVHPNKVTQLPYVPLTTPLATPLVTPASATSVTTTTTLTVAQ